MPEPRARATAAAVQLTKITDEILEVRKHQGQIRRNTSQFNEARPNS